MKRRIGLKTKLSENNPFSYDRYAFAFENIKDGSKCLDYGCYDGKFIYSVQLQRDSIEYVGIDKNKDIVDENPYNLNLQVFSEHIPFENGYFDFVSMLDVIEHIYNQDDSLRNINKVLKMNGTLLITVPKKHIFSFLDLGNYKFIFPTLHKLFYILKYSKKDYEYRYINNPSGLIGDVEKEKAWHQHFNEKELSLLLERNGFKVDVFDGSCLFQRVFILMDMIKLGFLIPGNIRHIDCKMYESSNLFCKAIKIKEIV